MYVGFLLFGIPSALFALFHVSQSFGLLVVSLRRRVPGLHELYNRVSVLLDFVGYHIAQLIQRGIKVVKNPLRLLSGCGVGPRHLLEHLVAFYGVDSVLLVQQLNALGRRSGHHPGVVVLCTLLFFSCASGCLAYRQVGNGHVEAAFLELELVRNLLANRPAYLYSRNHPPHRHARFGESAYCPFPSYCCCFFRLFRSILHSFLEIGGHVALFGIRLLSPFQYPLFNRLI